MNTYDLDCPQLTHVSLCAGYGGIDLGLRRVLRGLRTVAYAEIEEYACGVLAARMEGGQLDPAPIWTNVKSFPYSDFHRCVDILSAGYPCQPFSTAGLRAGKDDPRHLWPWIADGIAACQPGLVFLENVEGHVSMGLREVYGDLEGLGYKCAWGLFSAAECGACHRRGRLFLLAHSLRQRGQFSFGRQQPAKQVPGGESETWRAWQSWPIEPGLCGTHDGTSNRVDRLRLLGNGVVPATAALAFTTLAQHLGL